MRREGGDVGTEVQEGGQGGEDLLTTMIQSLLSQADTPPREVEGVSEEFCDGAFLPPLIPPRFKRIANVFAGLCSPRPRPPQIPQRIPNLPDLQQPLPRRRIPARRAVALPSYASV